MNSYEKKRRPPPHLVIPEDATESQILIVWGEEALERAYQVSHEIEEHVRRLLSDTSESSCSYSPNQGDQFLNIRHAGYEQDEAKDAVDNRKRRW